jgi:hypothetical protein
VSSDSLVLDSPGLSSWIDRDRKVMRFLEQAERDAPDLAISAVRATGSGHRAVTGFRFDL